MPEATRGDTHVLSLNSPVSQYKVNTAKFICDNSTWSHTIASIIDLILLNPPFDNPKMIDMCSTIL